MEHQLLKAIVALLGTMDTPHTSTRFDFSDQDSIRVFSWSVICDRPTSWACGQENWPAHLRRRPLPSQPTMSRRRRSPSVVALLDALERRVTAPQGPGLFWMIDGKPLPIGGGSKDRQAGYGKAAGCMAQGDKLHALVGSDGSLAGWRVAPMHKDEWVMAGRLLQAAPPEVLGSVAAAANFDSNRRHRIGDDRGDRQLVTPRRNGPGRETGNRKQTAGRLRSIALTESPLPTFAEQLLKDRGEIERQFGNMVNWGGGRNGLPAWVRTHRRVRRWVQAKRVLTRRKRDARMRTCAA